MSVNVEEIVRENITRTVHMSLATVSGDAPWVCEVHFAYDNDLNLYFRSKTSRRHCIELMANPKVAGNIIDKHPLGTLPVGIYFEGTGELLEDTDALAALADIFQSQLGAKDDIVTESNDPEGHQVYKIKVQNWHAFGKFGDAPMQRHTLAWNGGKV